MAPEGTRLQQVSGDLKKIERELAARPSVTGVSVFVGKGPPRFYLPVSPEDSYSSYAQLIVNTKTLQDVDELIRYLDLWARENVPEAMVRVRKYAVGSFNDWKIEARFSGPANADPDTLRQLAEKGMEILRADPQAKDVRTNWRQRVCKLVPQYNQQRGRWAGVSRDDLAGATKRSSERDWRWAIPRGRRSHPHCSAKSQGRTRSSGHKSGGAPDCSQTVKQHGTVSQVVDGITTEWEDPIIWRWDRRRAITVQCLPNGVTAPTLLKSIKSDFQSIPLPPGYRLEWSGEDRSSRESQQALIRG